MQAVACRDPGDGVGTLWVHDVEDDATGCPLTKGAFFYHICHCCLPA